ncbi:DUF4369 domain-containing protein [Aquimarina rhabdastrellae]
MKQIVSFFLLLTLIVSCSQEPQKEGNAIIKGNIKGLKKGTLFLQKIQDTTIINVDSIVLDGTSEFVLATQIDAPEVFFLHLDKKDGAQYNDRFDFFVEPGETVISTTLQDFEKDAQVVGSKNQEKFQEFKKIRRRFNEQHLGILKSSFEARKQNDTAVLIKNDLAYQSLIKRKYLYTVNFALTNNDLEVAPYVTMTDIFDANVKYLDTIANGLTPKVQQSNYGKQLIDFIKDRKEETAKLKEKTTDSVQ